LIDDVLPSILNEDSFWPSEPRTLEEAGIPELLVESLLCLQLLSSGTVSGRNLSERVGLTFALVDQQLAAMRMRQLVTHARPAPLNDFYYSLTENGQKRALSHQKVCSYAGPAPVPLQDYILSVEAQASYFEPVTEAQLKHALREVTYDPRWLDFLGPAVNSTAGIFLYGAPGNGKTTLAKCLTACRGQDVWIPHAIIDDGNIIKLFDAAYHHPVNSIVSNARIIAARDYDHRWVRIRRPTVVVGGELTLDNLEVRYDARSNVSEAPLQVKSNCGCLLIDDFGRQQVQPAELLNRWIVPLESHVDYLTLPSGKKISVPFEQTIIFSTNLLPESLVDEAFLRRVPFKIEIGDPGLAEYTELFRRACDAFAMQWRPDIVEEFIHKHYRSCQRPLRRCHPRDLLLQVKALATYYGDPPELRMDYLDKACNNYFGSSSTAFTQARRSAAVASPPPHPAPAALARPLEPPRVSDKPSPVSVPPSVSAAARPQPAETPGKRLLPLPGTVHNKPTLGTLKIAPLASSGAAGSPPPVPLQDSP
jgi:hypothetical protein